MASMANRGKNHVNSHTINGTEIKRGDCLLIRPAKRYELPYVARVEKLMSDQNKEMEIKVRWYYRPEDTEGGRKPFHGARELFISNTYDTLSVDTIDGKCVVHTFQNYIKLESVDDSDYFCRYKYDARVRLATSGERFSPNNVVVYCKCDMPYNPDIAMVQCDECLDWYHLPCLDMEIKDVEGLEKFSCFKCQ